MAVERIATGVASGQSITFIQRVIGTGFAGTGRLLTVFVGTRDFDGTAPTITNAFLQGTSINLVPWDTYITGSTYQVLYYLVIPTATSGNVTVEIDFSGLDTAGLFCATWRGVDPVNPVGAVVQATGGSTTPSTTGNNLSTQDALITGLTVNYVAAPGPTVTPTNSQTVSVTRIEYAGDPSLNFDFCFGQRFGGIPQGGNVTDSYSLTISEAWYQQSGVIRHQQAGGSVFGGTN